MSSRYAKKMLVTLAILSAAVPFFVVENSFWLQRDVL